MQIKGCFVSSSLSLRVGSNISHLEMIPYIENCMLIAFCSLSYPLPVAQCFEHSIKCSSNVNCKVPKDPEDRQLLGNCYLWGTWKISLAHSLRGGPKHRKAESCSKGHRARPLQSLLSVFMSFLPGSCLTMPNSTFFKANTRL